MRSRTRIVALLIIAALAPAGCSAEPKPVAAQPTPSISVALLAPGVNATDVMFAQMIVPHHGQGVALAKLAPSRSSNTELKQLAAAIAATQIPEASTAAGWLTAWKQPATAASNEHANHGGMPSTRPEEFAALSKLSGAGFDRRFLNTLLAHQDDAIQIAAMETGSGVNPEAKEFARRVEVSRKAQVDQMLRLIDKL